jgi:hypothetical protein
VVGTGRGVKAGTLDADGVQHSGGRSRKYVGTDAVERCCQTDDRPRMEILSVEGKAPTGGF